MQRKAGKDLATPLMLTKRGEEILKAVYFYRYMAALDVAHLLYSPSSLAYVRKLLTVLAGGADGLNNQYLYRFALPNVSAGNPQRIYTLGSRGRDYLMQEEWIEVDWYFRPHKVKHLSFSNVLHNLILTRFLVAAKEWAAGKRDFELTQIRTCYELGRLSENAERGDVEKTGKSAVIPDAWLLFKKNGKERPVLLEVDRGTAYQKNFKEHVKARIEYIKKGGAYSRLFGTEAVVIAYVTTGESVEYRETRRRSMCAWTQEVLKELRMESWARVFLFHSLSLEEIYSMKLFENRVWYRPDQEAPVGLFGG